MSALSAGMINFLVAATGATGASGVLTVSAAATQALRMVSAGGKIPDGKQSLSGVVFTWQSRIAFGVGSGDVSELQAAFDAWFIGNAELLTDDYTISNAAWEYNGITVPMTFGGQRSRTMISGESMVLCDKVFPSQFGPLVSLPRDANI